MALRKPKSPREVMNLVMRHRKKLIFPALAIAIAIVVASQWVPRMYRAEAAFVRKNSVAMEQMGDSTAQRNLNRVRRALQQDFKDSEFIEQIITDLGLDRGLSRHGDGTLTARGQNQLQELVEDMRQRISISHSLRSNEEDRIEVSYRDEDRQVAPRVANKLVENYVTETRKRLDRMLMNAKTFFEREVTRYQTLTSELQERKLHFETEHPGLMPDDPGAIQNKVAELRTKVESLREQDNRIRARITALQAWIKDQPEFVELRHRGQNPAYEEKQRRAAQLENELMEHLNRWNRTEDHPLVVRTRRSLEQVREELKEMDIEVTTGSEMVPNNERMQAQRELETLASEARSVATTLAQAEKKLEQSEALNTNFFVVRSEYLKILREMEQAERQLVFWEGNLRQTELALNAELSQSGVRLYVTDRALPPQKPFEPNFALIAMFALAAGLGLGAGLVVLAELLDHSFATVDHVTDELKLPVLGAINEIVPPRKRAIKRTLDLGVYPVLALAMLAVLGVALYVTYVSLQEPQRFEGWMTSLFGG